MDVQVRASRAGVDIDTRIGLMLGVNDIDEASGKEERFGRARRSKSLEIL